MSGGWWPKFSAILEIYENDMLVAQAQETVLPNEKAFSHILDRLRSTERTSYSVRTIEKIHIVVNEQGDTIRADRETSSSRTSIRERELERLLQSRDSTISALRLQVDSILSESTPRIIEVERKLSRCEQTKMDLGGIALGAVAVARSIAVVWLIKKFRR